MKGKAAVFVPGKGFEIREYEVSAKEGVVVRVRRANVCGSDLHIWRGEIDISEFGYSSALLGHEMMGIVEEIIDVETDALGNALKKGDRIIFPYYIPCGRCRPCALGKVNACLWALASSMRSPERPPHFVGGFAEFYVVSKKQPIFKVPDNIPDEIASSINCSLSQVIFGLQEVGFKFGETIVIQGAGGLGLWAVAVAKSMGASWIGVIDAQEYRLSLAKEFGADFVLNASEVQDPKMRTSIILQQTDGWGADVVVEVAGIPDIIPEGIRMLSRGGRYLEMGNIVPRKKSQIDPSLLVGPNRSIAGVSLYTPFTLKKSLDFLSQNINKYPFHKIFSKSFKLDEIQKAFEEAEAFGKKVEVGRVAVIPEVGKV